MRRLTILALGAAVSLAVTAGRVGLSAQDDSDVAIAAAQASLGRGQLKEGIAQLGAILERPALSALQRARTHQLLAAAYSDTGDHDACLEHAERAEAAAAPLDALDVLSRIEYVRGTAWRFRRATLRAVAHYRKGVALAERAGHRELVAVGYANLASAYQQIGDWSRVLDYAERGFEAVPDPSDAARLRYLIQRGIAYYEFDDRDQALAAFQAALALATKLGDRRSMSMSLGELGLVAWEFDRDRTRALAEYEKAIAIAREIGVPVLEASWLNNAANVYRDTGEWAEALVRYQQAVDIERRTGQRVVRAMMLKNIGQTLAGLGRFADAERSLLHARETADAVDDWRRRWESRLELGRFYRSRDRALARRYLFESIDVLEDVQSNVVLEDFRAGALSRALRTYDPFDLLIDVLLEDGDARGAFMVAERARARIFLETLGTAREAVAATIPAAIVEAETDLLRAISAEQTRLRAPGLTPSDRQRILDAIRGAEEKLRQVRLRLSLEHPAAAEARYPQLSPTDALQSNVLLRDEGVLMFFVGPTTSARWLVTKDAIEVTRLPPRDTIRAAVRDYLAKLATPSSSEITAEAARLGRLLLGDDALSRPGLARLVIVPHGILHYLPFEALAGADGRYLVERLVVSYAPSASSYAFLRGRSAPKRSGRVVLIGDPMTSVSSPAVERQARVEWMHLLKPLPHARQEVRDIAALFGGNSERLERERATEPALARVGLDDAAVLHFATHALIDESRPERSGLALSAAPPESDGLLQMREVYRLRAPVALVTLSACETALGQHVTGEGMVGLARAFFYAGAGAVLASLWSVDDASTAALMTSFYQRAQAGDALDIAMQQAKHNLIVRGGDLAHPYYWAPFVISGHAGVQLDVPPAPLSRRLELTLIGIGLLLAAVAAVAILRGRSSSRPA